MFFPPLLLFWKMKENEEVQPSFRPSFLFSVFPCSFPFFFYFFFVYVLLLDSRLYRELVSVKMLILDDAVVVLLFVRALVCVFVWV